MAEELLGFGPLVGPKLPRLSSSQNAHHSLPTVSACFKAASSLPRILSKFLQRLDTFDHKVLDWLLFCLSALAVSETDLLLVSCTLVKHLPLEYSLLSPH
jgi:hypothetical protein